MSEMTNETADRGSGNFDADPNLGKFARDKVTGFEGIITVKGVHLFGCNTYALAPKVKDGKIEDTHSFDEARIEIIDEGVRPSDVQGSRPGGDYSASLEKRA